MPGSGEADIRRQAALFEHEEEAGGRVAVEGPFAGVVFNRPVDQVFSYRIPPGLRAKVVPGQRVKVPLGRGNTPSVGYCVRVDDSAEVDPRKVKDVIDVLDDPPLIDGAMLDLTRWIAGYYSCTWGQALDSVVPAGVKKQAGTRVWTCLTVPESTLAKRLDGSLKLNPKQLEVIDVVARADVPLTLADVCNRAKCRHRAWSTTLRKQGLIHTVKRRISAPPADDDGEEVDRRPAPELTLEQKAALDQLRPEPPGATASPRSCSTASPAAARPRSISGAIEEVVARGREAIVLVPEISLTPQTIRRFRRRFDRVAVLHSHLSEGERHRHWRSIANGEVQVVVGARSAVFAPTRKLGLIVIDEEHEGSFKQETVPRYHARDVAVKRAQLEGVPVVLGSATPALETWRNAQTGRYTRIALDERVGARPMPDVTLIDMRYEKPAGVVLSTPLKTAMTEALDDGGQVILLLNRRGFNTYAVCVNPGCRSILKCRHCDVSLTYHQGRRKLVCHFCDAELERIPTCPTCRKLLYYGGIGTERLEREVRARVPRPVDPPDGLRHDARPRQPREGARRVQGGRGPDPARHPDDRQGARLPQRDAGRGRRRRHRAAPARLPGRRADLPDRHPGRRPDRPRRSARQGPGADLQPRRRRDRLTRKDHDYHGFVAGELVDRQKLGLPPFGRLVRLIARGEDAMAVKAYLESLHQALMEARPSVVAITAVVPAPVEKIRNLYRFHLRMRCPSPKPLQDLLKAIPPRFPPPNGVELAIDVDPIGML